MATDSRNDHDAEPAHSSSPTAHLLEHLQLYGHRAFEDEPDQRLLPDPQHLEHTLADVFDALVSALSDTRLEPDLADLLWSQVSLFHRKVERVQRELDDNESAQRQSQERQDGSEIRSVELERLLAQGLTLMERRNAFEFLRDHAAELYEIHTGTAWRPRNGSMVNHRTMTAAMIDSRNFINAKRRAETEVLLPAGPRIAFTGGLDFNDHARIWHRLDKLRAKHPDMVLLHGGSPKGAERIAACWADARKVPQIAFKPEWTRHNKAAPFKRNDRMLETMPIGVVIFPGSGISENLADKAKKLGIPVWRFGGRGA
ncbi:Protein of unknown function [Rhizobiales bacterium GAS191]|nr:Protein of unknown function [Rhizobiales bacterium GAS191]